MPRNRRRQPRRRTRSSPLSRIVDIGSRTLTAAGLYKIPISSDADKGAKIVSFSGSVVSASNIIFQPSIINVASGVTDTAYTAVGPRYAVGVSPLRWTLRNYRSSDFLKGGDIGCQVNVSGPCVITWKITFLLQPDVLPASGPALVLPPESIQGGSVATPDLSRSASFLEVCASHADSLC